MTSSGTATAPVQAYPLITRIAIEGLGSFFIVFAGLGTALFSPAGSGATIGFAYGLAMVAAIISFGHVSNGYFNPAFSLGMAVAGRLKFSAAVFYMVAQTVGAVLASVVWLAMMKVMPAGATPETPQLFGALANGFDAHSPSQVPMIGVLIVELVAVGVLTAMLLGATSARNKTTMGPIAIGLAFAVAVAITMPLSNGSLNPARATSVVFLAESWAAGQLWLFWLAPLFGATLAAVIYRAFAPSQLLTVSEQVPDSVPVTVPATNGIVAPAATEAPIAVAATEAPVNPAATTLAKDTGIDDAQAFFDAPKK
ncbi:hypothetical protein AS189_07965 [Arthrobacter alpinus]|uniref:Aquaporin Z n=1 Tax=Arthrobacter alpinus TaxID=656366 RepID=A0A0S2LY06_9MICC|nr:aquaporin [Arthrobacter alpinus]ALO66441.1 hypothetical protein AS189_07965 [Arthrobacter alpinus]